MKSDWLDMGTQAEQDICYNCGYIVRNTGKTFVPEYCSACGAPDDDDPGRDSADVAAEAARVARLAARKATGKRGWDKPPGWKSSGRKN